MQSIIKRILPILILGIVIDFSITSLTFFSANDTEFEFQSVIAAEPPANNKETSTESSPSKSLDTPETQNFIRQKWQLLKGELRWDVYEIFVGTFLSIIGLAAIALALFRWKSKDLSLISFGILCFLNGARTSAVIFFFDISNFDIFFWFL